ncbi:winged helix-turn-helix domain-containing protein [Thalassotalea hakodatensis]|uniref:winged helix-turn-helix domain-containing protein n=1 Tax=Thalassotalea hakodatensis TaxID=3030492 RepID=UPI00257321F4|nr:winged helix-turn-helix domain-containing protein [Thalassotalea hakodatensis]
MVSFDHVSYRIHYEDTSVELQPLNFKLLRLLWDNANQVVGVNEILEAVWGSRSVSSDTIKQRVFLLRKVIQAEGICDFEIKSIRGEGYKLITHYSAPDSLENRPNTEQMDVPKVGINILSPRLILLFTCFAIFISVFIWQKKLETQTGQNNRLALWLYTDNQATKDSLVKVRRLLTDRVVKSQKYDIQIVLSEFDQALSIPQQARTHRIGLLVFLALEDNTTVNARILEPKTATILSSYQIQIDRVTQELNGQEQLIEAVLSLFNSGKLVLTKDMLVNADHPIWGELVQIASKNN